jgi:nucleotide-binding universal stress UspA family protein
VSDLPKLSELAIEAAKTLTKEVYADIGHPVAASIGDAIKSALDIVLLPVHLAAYPATKANLVLKQNLRDFARRLTSVREENMKKPPNEVAVPILQRLTYVEDDDIRRMYIELLAKASDKAQEQSAHPSFIHVIEAISPDEARMVQFFRDNSSFPYVWVRMAFITTPAHEKFPMSAPGLDLTTDLTGLESHLDLRFPSNIPLYLTNCMALGLITRHDGELSDTNRHYLPLEEMYDVIRNDLFNRGHNGKQYPVFFVRGYYRITPFGKAFIKAVIPDSGDPQQELIDA